MGHKSLIYCQSAASNNWIIIGTVIIHEFALRNLCLRKSFPWYELAYENYTMQNSLSHLKLSLLWDESVCVPFAIPDCDGDYSETCNEKQRNRVGSCGNEYAIGIFEPCRWQIGTVPFVRDKQQKKDDLAA